MTKFIKSTLILLLFAVFIPINAYGATVKIGDSYSFNKSEISQENLYIGAGEVFVDGNILGDLITAGGSVSVSGEVLGDTTIAGGDISVLNQVGDDLRIIGGDVLVTSSVSGDLVIIGGNVRILSSASVGKDLVVFGGRVVLDGNVNGKVRIIAGDVTIDSKIAGDVEIRATEKITLGDSAVISGNLLYKGKNESIINISENALIVGETTFEESKNASSGTKNMLAKFFGTFLLIKLLSIIAVATLLTILFKKISNHVVRDAVDHIGGKLLWGFIALIVIPAAVLVSFATIVGILIGLLGLIGYIIFLMLSTVYGGIIFGAWMEKLIMKKEIIAVNWKNGILGVIALTLIIQVPFLGNIIGLFFFLIALGSIVSIVYHKLWLNRK